MWPFKEKTLERPEMFCRKFLVELYDAQDTRIFETDLDVVAAHEEPNSLHAYELFKEGFIEYNQHKIFIVTSEYEGGGKTFIELDWSKVVKTHITAYPRKDDWASDKSYSEERLQNCGLSQEFIQELQHKRA